MLKNDNIRLNSEKRISNPNFNLKVGTVNKLNPEAIYFEGKTFIAPTVNKLSYDRDVNEIEHSLKHRINRSLMETDLFGERYILDFKVSLKALAYNKKTFLSFQLMLRQKNEVKKLKDLKTSASFFINDIVYDLEESIKEHSFVLTKSKKE